jgi:SNF2 family DNA or RNA helicase
MYCLDMGERLGKSVTKYRETYFETHKWNNIIVRCSAKKGCEAIIRNKISDICLSMRAEDYLEMPMTIDGGMQVRLPELDAYRKFERDNLMTLKDGAEIQAVTAVALANKLLQFASGAVYDDDHCWHQVSTAKDEALADLLDQAEAAGESVLVFYSFRHELERIKALHPEAVQFTGEPEILKAWNEGTVPVMLAHPASVGYGLNLQAGGHIIVWFSPTWNLELYEQANARLVRQGQTKPVVIYHLVCPGTMDETVMAALRRKSDTQTAVMNYIKRKRKEL